VVFANTLRCLAELSRRGGSATVVDLGPLDHVPSAVAALPLIRAWFTPVTPPPGTAA